MKHIRLNLRAPTDNALPALAVDGYGAMDVYDDLHHTVSLILPESDVVLDLDVWEDKESGGVGVQLTLRGGEALEIEKTQVGHERRLKFVVPRKEVL